MCRFRERVSTLQNQGRSLEFGSNVEFYSVLIFVIRGQNYDKILIMKGKLREGRNFEVIFARAT